MNLVRQCICNKNSITIQCIGVLGQHIHHYIQSNLEIDTEKEKEAEGSLQYYLDINLKVTVMLV